MTSRVGFRPFLHSALPAILVLFILTGCSSAPTALTSMPIRLPPTDTPAPPLITETFSPTFNIFTEVYTPLPTSTPIGLSIATFTGTPRASLSQAGPWLALSSDEGLWVMDPDLTAISTVADIHGSSNVGLQVSISPAGGRIAYVIIPPYPLSALTPPPEITLVSLPSNSISPLTRLFSGKMMEAPTPGPDSSADVYAAVFENHGLVWSPDGSHLAFIGAHDGPSADLYAYSTRSGTITRLTSGPTQAIDPMWSPDGQYIVSSGATDMEYGKAGTHGPIIDSIWAVRPDGSGLREVHSYPGGQSGPPILTRWINGRSYVESYDDAGCGMNKLTYVDILSPVEYSLIPGAFNSADLDPGSGTLLSLINPPANLENCGPFPDPGWYLLSVFGDKPRQKVPFQIPTRADESGQILGWSPAAQLFFISSNNNLYTVTLKGEVTVLNISGIDSLPEVSPDGVEWAIFNPAGGGLWIASPYYPTITVYQGAVETALWAPDSSTLYFVAGNVLYRADPPNYQPGIIAGPFDGSDYRLSWVMP